MHDGNYTPVYANVKNKPAAGEGRSYRPPYGERRAAMKNGRIEKKQKFIETESSRNQIAGFFTINSKQ